MKHKPKIILILLAMFLLTQFIGLYVINYYSVPANPLPLGMGYPQTPQNCQISSFAEFFSCTQYLGSLIFAFVLAITLFLFLSKIRAEFIIRIWFFFVVSIALLITFQSFIPGISYAFIISIIVAVLFAFLKVFKRNMIIHNITELLIYPGIAAIFVPILNIYTMLILLVLISVYDMWAVWHSKIMIKMARFQINKVKTFSGFFVPYISKKVRLQLKKLRSSKSKIKGKKIKVNVAILGGGDVVFPMIAAGVVLKYILSKAGIESITFSHLIASNYILAPLLVIVGAILGLTFLFIFSEKRKFYPAMPFITAGIFLGLLVAWLVSLI